MLGARVRRSDPDSDPERRRRTAWPLTLGIALALLAGSPILAQSLTIDDVTAAEGDSGTTPFVFTVTLSPSSGATVTVNFATANGSAAAPSDFTATSGTLTFNPGETTKTITVDVNGDTTYEGDETFLVSLSGATNATIGDAVGVGIITNDDVRVSIGDATVIEGDSGPVPMVFDVTLSGPKNNLTITVDYATANGSAVAPGDYTAASGTVTFLPGETAKTVTVYAQGDTIYEGTETFSVNLSNAVNSSIFDGFGLGSITDDDVRVSIGDATVIEGDSGPVPMVFDVTLSGPKNNLTITVDYATANGSAVAPGDYTATSGTVTFLPGETAKTVTVYAQGDTIYEGTDTFSVSLSNVVNGSIFDGTGLGLITDDDVRVSIGDVTMDEGNSGTTPFIFPVTLSGPKNNLTLTVDYATANGSAVAPGDYTAASGTVTFLPGETAKTVTVQVVGDLALEGNETFTVNLSNPVNCSLGDSQGLGVIDNDDVAGALSIDDLSLPEGDAGTTPFDFTVNLSAPSVSTVSVHFATADGTAVAGQDYAAASGTVSFAPGETSKVVTVSVFGDTMMECTETFFVNLSSPSGAAIADGQAIGTIQDDDNATCPDLDGDCQRDAACGGTDCDDLNPDVYLGAVEINDGVDNECPGDPGYGTADDISGTCGFLDAADPTLFSWPVQELAVDYELVRASSADFATGCTVVGSTTDTSLQHAAVPASRAALFYLVRPLTPNLGSFGPRSSGVPRTVPCAP
jgi:hypothetical protein